MRVHSRWLPVAASTLLLLAGCDDRPNAPSSVPAPTSSGPLAITGVSPRGGFAGQHVIVSGTGFVPGITLTLGGVPASNVALGIGSVGGTIPPHAGGLVDVVVTNPDGRSATHTDGFTYLTVSLTVSANPVRPGEQLSVSWEAPGRAATSDWIGLFEIGVPSTNYEGRFWDYTGSASGTLTLTAPGVGDYEFRYLLDDGFFDVARAAVAVR
jgi:hypothetical protein